MAEQYNISAIQGSTLLLNVNCRDSNSDYINLSGYTARGAVRYSYSSTGTLMNLNPQVHPSYVSGLITISGNADDMAELKAGVYVYDIEASGGGFVFKPIRGYFTVDAEVTF